MYRVLKSKGSTSNVTVENTDTRASVTIGRLNAGIIHELNRAGFKEDDNLPPNRDEWNFEIKEETAKALASMAFKMSKPIRDQRKPETKKQANKHIDAMDVMLGLASYSK